MMPAGWLLVAAGLDWLEGLLPVLFLVIWIVSQVMTLFRGANKPAGGPGAPPRRPPQPARSSILRVRPPTVFSLASSVSIRTSSSSGAPSRPSPIPSINSGV